MARDDWQPKLATHILPVSVQAGTLVRHSNDNKTTNVSMETEWQPANRSEGWSERSSVIGQQASLGNRKRPFRQGGGGRRQLSRWCWCVRVCACVSRTEKCMIFLSCVVYKMNMDEWKCTWVCGGVWSGSQVSLFSLQLCVCVYV